MNQSNMSKLSIKEQLRRKTAQMRIPSEGTFELTPRCTMSCKMCYIVLNEKEQKKIGKELTAAQWLSLAEQAAQEGLTDLLLTGGEPFIRHDFYEILKGVTAMGILTRINTNATLITEKAIEALREAAPYRFNVTLYGASNETYEKLCGFPGGFDRVSQAIDLLIDAGFNVKISFTPNPLNAQDVEKVKEFVQKRGLVLQCSNFIFQPIDSNKTDIFAERVNPKATADMFYALDNYRLSQEVCIREANRLKSILERQKSGEIPFAKRDKMTCGAGRNNFWINWQGKMYPCGMMKFCETEPLKTGFRQAWEYTVSHVDDMRLPKQCSSCEYGYFCHVCAAQIIGETGSIGQLAPYLCELTKANADALLKYAD